MDIEALIEKYQEQQSNAARLFEQYKEVKGRALSPMSAANYTEIKIKGNGGKDAAYIKTIAAWEKWQAAQMDYIETRQELFDVIMKLENPDELDVLYFRLIERMKHREIIAIWPEEHRGEILEADAEMAKFRRGYKHLQELARTL